MKKWVLSLSLAAGVIGLAGCSSNSGGEAVVKTSAGNITKEELYEAMKDKVGEQVLQQLVLDKVLSKDYKVSDKEVDEKVEEVKSQVGPQFEMLLSNYGYKDEEDFRHSLKLSLLQEKAATKDIKVTDKEVKEYYDSKKPEIEVRHILVEEEKTAKEAKAKLDKGEDFAAVAKEYSKDPGSAEKGGELGFISTEDPSLDEQFKEAAFKLKKDEISVPVQTQFGYHIIQVTDIKEKEPFDKVKDKYEYELKVSKLDPDTVQKTLKNELEKSKVKVEDKELKSTFDPILNVPAQEDGAPKEKEEKK
ncbi:peptidylprolyl isomerase [Lederbergia citrea]|uniref:Foldase protein PrsA n=1 Tax=Lederbergia citrea TaxID=2833581 RepID=A0A942UGX8_9BACI|nr:peptidylprolyl isomerase [Lederbergia citrea]MBS4177512.1 peptidylprolyl isomerase [Lederbergia citrea]MBS4204185.1 peptidylprolyl isomerase [Lederbergia citrea]MBS4221230.1 peptidylprolyl isomerase [Lederbergia citrea]